MNYGHWPSHHCSLVATSLSQALFPLILIILDETKKEKTPAEVKYNLVKFLCKYLFIFQPEVMIQQLYLTITINDHDHNDVDGDSDDDDGYVDGSGDGHDVDGDDGDGDDDDVITPPLSLATAHLFPAPNLARHTFAPELYLVYVWISTFLVNTFLHR